MSCPFIHFADAFMQSDFVIVYIFILYAFIYSICVVCPCLPGSNKYCAFFTDVMSVWYEQNIHKNEHCCMIVDILSTGVKR